MPKENLPKGEFSLGLSGMLTPQKSARWGIVTTAKARPADIFAFCAHHLRAGAERIYVHLDDGMAPALAALKQHRKIRVIPCTPAYWQAHIGARPDRHQIRQSKNASRAYHAAKDLDWLLHIDIDEFLVSADPIAQSLAAVPDGALCARIRPMEALAGDDTAFKAYLPHTGSCDAAVERIYPTYGAYVKGGFLSHLAGKIFVRTGHPGLKLRIHNFSLGGIRNPSTVELPQIDLAHLHATSWDRWIRAYRYRLTHGAYRASLGTNRSRSKGGVTMHELLTTLEDHEGEDGLRSFFDEMCVARPALLGRLTQENALKRVDLQLRDAIRTHFPEVI